MLSRRSGGTAGAGDDPHWRARPVACHGCWRGAATASITFASFLCRGQRSESLLQEIQSMLCISRSTLQRCRCCADPLRDSDGLRCWSKPCCLMQMPQRRFTVWVWAGQQQCSKQGVHLCPRLLEVLQACLQKGGCLPVPVCFDKNLGIPEERKAILWVSLQDLEKVSASSLQVSSQSKEKSASELHLCDKSLDLGWAIDRLVLHLHQMIRRLGPGTPRATA
mmetsp:Transcript_100607/g.189741  ORF Transcript_100607/g.189741 Transcript_100607/m.189741 type:complete len:222 (-) Transcript_100607:595-1260(-)